MSLNPKLRRRLTTEWADRGRQDVLYAWRGLRRSPGFTLVVVIVLALGLGANAAIFSVLDRVFLSVPAGVDAPQEIRRLYYTQPESPVRAFGPANGVDQPMKYSEYAAIRASAERGVQFAAYDMRPDSVEARVGNAVVPVMASYVTESYFTTLRVRPALGRTFTPDEDRVESPGAVAVISDALWLRAFGGDHAVLGRRIRIADRTYSVVGVAPPRFTGIDLDRADLWLPLGALPTPPFLGEPWYQAGFGVLRVIARVPSSVTPQRMAATATAAYRGARQTRGLRDTTSTVLTGPIIAALGPADRPQEVSISLRLAGVSLMLLLIAVGNVANLLLVRGAHRRREIAIRRALGVSTARLCRLLITESLMLSTVGAAAAVLIAVWGSMALRALLLPDTHWSSDSQFTHIVAFTAIASIAVGTVAGLAPVLHAAGLDVSSALKLGGKSRVHRRVWARSGLTIAQVALSVVLLVGAGLFVRSLQNVRAIDLGFNADGLVTVHARYHDLARSREVGSTFERMVTELLRTPGVRSVAMASGGPMQGSMAQRLFLPGRDSVPTIDGMPPINVLVSPAYFSTVGVHLVSGRVFATTDDAAAAPVAVVSRTMARVVWAGEDPIGKCLRVFSRTAPCTNVVGVVEDVHTDDVVEPKPFMRLYLLFSQNAQLDSLRFGPRGIERVLLVRARPGTESAVMRSAQRIARERLAGAAELRVNDMAQVLEPKLRPWRLGATLFSALGVLAAIVALVGVYSVIAYATSQRTHEMSVRMALGAGPRDILTLVAGEGLRIVLVSFAIGMSLAVAMGRLVASLLYGVSTRDPAVFAGAAVVVAVMGFAATLSPALRAARSDPARALRAE